MRVAISDLVRMIEELMHITVNSRFIIDGEYMIQLGRRSGIHRAKLLKTQLIHDKDAFVFVVLEGRLKDKLVYYHTDNVYIDRVTGVVKWLQQQ